MRPSQPKAQGHQPEAAGRTSQYTDPNPAREVVSTFQTLGFELLSGTVVQTEVVPAGKVADDPVPKLNCRTVAS